MRAILSQIVEEPVGPDPSAPILPFPRSLSPRKRGAGIASCSAPVPAFVFADKEAWASVVESRSVFIELAASNTHSATGLRTADIRPAVRDELSWLVSEWKIVDSEEKADIIHDSWYWTGKRKLLKHGQAWECRIEGRNRKTDEPPERTLARAIAFILRGDGIGGGPG
jgi:hypothetical protein